MQVCMCAMLCDMIRLVLPVQVDKETVATLTQSQFMGHTDITNREKWHMYKCNIV